MTVFKCKMCGATLEAEEGKSVVTCDYCGSVQTLPSSREDITVNLFNRATNIRLRNDFDKAAQVYEKILDSDDRDAEAHWGLVLCKYGIEYVEDPKTGVRVPTCHRTLTDSVMTDADYLAAIENADPLRRKVYEDEAKKIAALQKEILEISANEEPFDVFICYKETDGDGKRTPDSVLANDIYYQLTREGLKVFFAAITLENRLGTEYEPYIYAALHSAKVMLVIGTRPEYFDAVWVKNEWSRYLSIMKNDRTRTLIPCYRDMDAYDLPEEFAHLQAQDMSKIGFISDLVRGIRKLTAHEKSEKNEAVPTAASAAPAEAGTASLLRRVFIFLEDGDWESADEYCEKVLDIDPECGEAYLGKLLAEMKLPCTERLIGLDEAIEGDKLYQKIMRYGTLELCGKLRQINEHIVENKKERVRKSTEIIMPYAVKAARLPVLATNCGTLGIKADGTVIASSWNRKGKNDINDWKGIVQISSGYDHTVGLRADGTAVAAGSNEYRQCEVSEWHDIVAIAAGNHHTVGLKSDGSVVSTCNGTEQDDISCWSNIVAISAGNAHTVGLRSDGTVTLAGFRDLNQCDVFDWQGIVSVFAQGYHTVGLRSDGTVMDTHFELKNQCAEWTDIVAISAGSSFTVGLRSDGTIASTDFGFNDQCSKWKNIVAISAGIHHIVGLMSDGTVVAVGSTDGGRCNVSAWRDMMPMTTARTFEEDREEKIKIFEKAKQRRKESQDRFEYMRCQREKDKRLREVEQRLLEERRASYRSRGVCQYCGGKFKGLFSKKCSACGTPKDYR